MKFVDEVVIAAIAGNGGHGCLSFRREKYIPRGGPDGGDGGDGGDVMLQATSDVNTLVDFRYTRQFKSGNGQGGSGKNKTGRGGDALILEVPLGTIVYDHDTCELIGELLHEGQRMLVAKGGVHGLGNTRFKSSVNRTPRQITQGQPGERRNLKLELKLLADVGLLGFPNAGKSTFIRSVSAARPKVADYPFTTMVPNLGVVKVERHKSFVIADIPGIIEGASEGAGLGLRFLKHVSRTELLLHLVDVADPAGVPVLEAIDQVVAELHQFDAGLAQKPRWLVLSKIDLLPEGEQEDLVQQVQSHVGDVPVFAISSVTHHNIDPLLAKIMMHVDGHRLAPEPNLDYLSGEEAHGD